MHEFKKLEEYLEKIDHFLGNEKGGDEILAEIRSHILEKAESEFGKISEESVNKTIAGFGSPRKVAETYLEGYQIIAPVFRKHLFIYTGILFAFHYGLIVFSYFFNLRIQMIPLFIVPGMENFFDLISLLPMTLVFDFGLVGIFLYFVTRQKREVPLPWPGFFKREPKKIAIKEPKIFILIMLFALFSAAVYVFLRFHSVFFYSIDFKDAKPLFHQPAATYYSLAVILVLGMEIIAYIIRFFRKELVFLLELVKNGICLIILWFIHNYPFENALAVDMKFEIKFFFLPITWGLALIIVLDSLHVVYKMSRQKRSQINSNGDRG